MKQDRTKTGNDRTGQEEAAAAAGGTQQQEQ